MFIITGDTTVVIFYLLLMSLNCQWFFWTSSPRFIRCNINDEQEANQAMKERVSMLSVFGILMSVVFSIILCCFATFVGVVRTAGYGLCDGGIWIKIVVKQLYVG
jgi:uncharacterized membrane protein